MEVSTVTVDLFFHDISAIRLAGIKTSETGQIQVLPGAIPATGDIVRFAKVNYQSGEMAFFRVASRTHLFGGEHTQRIQLSLTIVVAHQP